VIPLGEYQTFKSISRKKILCSTRELLIFFKLSKAFHEKKYYVALESYEYFSEKKGGSRYIENFPLEIAPQALKYYVYSK
jgi:hypothetical protein